MARKLYIVLMIALVGGCASQKVRWNLEGRQPLRTVAMGNDELSVVLVDNSSFGENHRAGYNGIAELRHIEQDSSIFVPFYAGFNLEHIFGGDSLPVLFEPRKHEMRLFRLSERRALLYQPPTPLSHVESWTVFELVEPHYIDVTFECRIHSDDFFRHGYAGLFWASYIHAPEDKKIYFLGHEKGADSTRWIAAFSEKHGVKSTHRWARDTTLVYFAPNFNATLASHFSDYVFEYPFYFGRFHNMVLAYMFDPPEGIRFSQSPTGGGKTNPAWDFQFIIPHFKPGEIYSFRARIVYKPFVSMEDVRREYEKWVDALRIRSSDAK